MTTTPGAGHAATGPAGAVPQPARVRRLVLAIIGILGIVISAVAWAFASPIGGAPDDDYHLTSIWCPTPLESSGCSVTFTDGRARVEVPEPVGRAATCFKFRSFQSASCLYTQQPDRLTNTWRVDNGDYPWGYYQFQHQFVGNDIDRSILVMRVVNILVATIGLVAVAALAAPTERRNLTFAIFGSWVPVGIYLVASNNPSSWAISGVLIFAAALLSATKTQGWRTWALLGVALYGALVACTARTDATIYCIIVAAAVFLLTPLTRRQVRPIGLAMLVAIGAMAVFLSAGQSSTFTSVGTGQDAPGFNQLLFDNFINLPRFTAGFWGMFTGLGWVDVHLHAIASISCLMVGTGLFFLALGEMNVRKLLAAGMLLGAIVTIPMVVTLANKQFLIEYQPRYLLPLLAPFFLLALSTRSGRPLRTSPWQLIAAVVMLSVGYSFALHTSLRRYVTGLDVLGLRLDYDIEWWWSFGPTPMLWWVIGSSCFLVGVTALALLTWDGDSTEPSELVTNHRTREGSG